MLKIGQNLPLDSKTAQHFVGIRAPLENFDRDALFKLSVGALRQINGSHTAASEFADNRVSTDALADPIAFVSPQPCRRELCKFFENSGIAGEELFRFVEEGGVVRARFSEHCSLPFD